MLHAAVGVSQARQTALVAARLPIPPVVNIFALVDTGASCTCIDPSVLQSLQLTPTGSTPMNTPSTGTAPHVANQYDVSIIIAGPGPTHPPFFSHTVPVVEAQLPSAQGFHALIGRDILEHSLFSYNGTAGIFTLAY
jgi:hypothetical protein